MKTVEKLNQHKQRWIKRCLNGDYIQEEIKWILELKIRTDWNYNQAKQQRKS